MGRKTLREAADRACKAGTERAAPCFGRLTAQDGGSATATEAQPWCQLSCVLGKEERELTRETGRLLVASLNTLI